MDHRQFNIFAADVMSGTMMSDTTMTDSTDNEPPVENRAPQRELPPAARRALAEAEARRAAALAREAEAPREIGGRGGNDPVRYGDWEIKGMACDF